MKYKQKAILIASKTDELSDNIPLVHGIYISQSNADSCMKESIESLPEWMCRGIKQIPITFEFEYS